MANRLQFLAVTLERALLPDSPKTFQCSRCTRLSAVENACEFCLADELYKLRKTMPYQTLDLNLQTAVYFLATTPRSKEA
jgi:hypothetical protein